MRILEICSSCWLRLSRWYRLMVPLRFVLLGLIAPTLAFKFTNQGVDAIRFMLESSTVPWARIASVTFATLIHASFVWYWARLLLRIRFTGRPPAASALHFVEWLPRVLGILSFAGIMWAVASASDGIGDRISLAATIAICCLSAGAAVFLVAVITRRKWLVRRGESVTRQVSSSSLFPPATRRILRLSVAFWLVFLFVIIGSPVEFPRTLMAANIVLISCALWIPVGSFLVYLSEKLRLPLLSMVVILAAALSYSSLVDNHSIEGVPFPQGYQRRSIEDEFRAWLSDRPSEASLPVFVVAAEGGGIRAAYWTAGVLSSLQDRHPEFADHVFAISSVSGGSLGASVFTALRARQLEDPSLRNLSAISRQILAGDALAPTLAAMLQPELVQRIVPWPRFPGRDRALEQSWEASWSEALTRRSDGVGGRVDDGFRLGLLQMYARHPGRLPSLFLNATTVETGDPIIISNCVIRENKRAPAQSEEEAGGVPAANDALVLLGSDLPLSRAAGLSARFPYVSPAGTLRHKGSDLLHVIDGGYFENTGAATAASLLRILSRVADDERREVRLVLVTISFGGELSSLGSVIATDPYSAKLTGAQQGLKESLSPVRGLLNTRAARGRRALAEARSEADDLVRFVLVQGKIELPLGWLLAGRSRDSMDYQLDPAQWKPASESFDTIGEILGEASPSPFSGESRDRLAASQSDQAASLRPELAISR